MKRTITTLHCLGLVSLASLAALPASGSAHGFAGKRFFPATIATDDPFVADELSLPTLSTSRSADDPPTREQSISGEFAKRITPDFGVSVGANYLRLSPQGEATTKGFDNLEANFKYQLYRGDAAETLAAIGLNWDIGGSGSKQVGAERFSTYTPTFYFGKGFGDLPAAAQFLKPLAITGTVGVALPARTSTTTTTVDPDTGDVTTDVARHPNVLQVGFAIQYNLQYLQSNVKDVGLPEPFNRMIPLVEFTLERPLNRVDDKRVTGTIYPGVLWAGRYIQLGIEAIVPLNNRSGHGVGVQAQLHFFLDDLFPSSFGRPLFGGRQ